LQDNEYWKPYTNVLDNLAVSLFGILRPYIERKLQKHDDETSARLHLQEDIEQATDSIYAGFIAAFETAIPLVEGLTHKSDKD